LQVFTLEEEIGLGCTHLFLQDPKEIHGPSLIHQQDSIFPRFQESSSISLPLFLKFLLLGYFKHMQSKVIVLNLNP
jgi:hypothetical protein